MRSNKIARILGTAIALLFAVLLILIARFEYVTTYRISDIDYSYSDDRRYELRFQSVGEPDFPFGYSHARFVLKHDGKTIIKYKFDVANDGAILFPDNWQASWLDDCVKVSIKGEEQNNVVYTLYFDGVVCLEEAPDISGLPLCELVEENEKGEAVFALTVEELSALFDSVYSQSHGAGYFGQITSENRTAYSERSPLFGCEALRRIFSADMTVLPMPTVSIYTSGNGEIYELRMTFDDHGYQERLYQIYRELCLCMERIAFPGLSENEIFALFTTLYDGAYNNFFGDHAFYGDPERPTLDAVYRRGNIGVYSFYGSGNIEICFVPLTENSLSLHELANTEIVEI